jgi:protein-S-isoprenylcysteine O-methyltransferase Ste14
MFIVRTALEDQTLHEELTDYPAYAQKVRYRLFPGIW